MNEKTVQKIVWGVLALVVLAFTLFAFVIKQDCDIDKVYLWCRVHPLGFFDILGIVIFYGSAVFMSGILPIQLVNEENTTRWNYVMFAVMFLAFVMIWNL